MQLFLYMVDIGNEVLKLSCWSRKSLLIKQYP
jgi:hypothetical protein